jgi:adenylylsulfate kinase
MKNEGNNIFSVFDEIIPRKEKEEKLNQRSKVVWMTGLSGSGKTTIAKIVERKLQEKGFLSQILDGDNIRAGINNNLGFSEEDRKENIRRIAEVSKLFLNCGIITINCFVSPTIEIRELAKVIVGKEDFLEVFVDTPLEECEKRDTKGLYKKARKGLISDFTGISSPFENPVNPFIKINTIGYTAEESAEQVLKALLPIIQYQVNESI